MCILCESTIFCMWISTSIQVWKINLPRKLKRCGPQTVLSKLLVYIYEGPHHQVIASAIYSIASSVCKTSLPYWLHYYEYVTLASQDRIEQIIGV
jgi:hypothetical protein